MRSEGEESLPLTCLLTRVSLWRYRGHPPSSPRGNQQREMPSQTSSFWVSTLLGAGREKLLTIWEVLESSREGLKWEWENLCSGLLISKAETETKTETETKPTIEKSRLQQKDEVCHIAFPQWSWWMVEWKVIWLVIKAKDYHCSLFTYL